MAWKRSLRDTAAVERDSVAVVRVGLRRMEVAELVRQDEALRTSALARAMGELALERLLEDAVLRRFADQSAVFREGDRPAALFWVVRGEVRLRSRRGEEHVDFGGASAGDLFGEDCAGLSPRSYSAVAVGDADVVEISTEALRIVGAHEPALKALLAELGKSRREAQIQMFDFLGRW
jgi:CRP-like cAMP-binding protein